MNFMHCIIHWPICMTLGVVSYQHSGVFRCSEIVRLSQPQSEQTVYVPSGTAQILEQKEREDEKKQVE